MMNVFWIHYMNLLIYWKYMDFYFFQHLMYQNLKNLKNLETSQKFWKIWKIAQNLKMLISADSGPIDLILEETFVS